MTTSSQDPDFIRRRNRGRLQLILLAIVFLGPLALAFSMFYGGFLAPAESVEHGRLIEPARPLPQSLLAGNADGLSLTGRWTLLMFTDGDCDDRCREMLYETRQLRRALGRDADRVQRLWIAGANAADPAFLAGEHPELVVMDVEQPAARQLRQLVGDFTPGEVFLIDPQGNLMMRYPPGLDMRPMHSDLKRLLKVSQVG